MEKTTQEQVDELENVVTAAVEYILVLEQKIETLENRQDETSRAIRYILERVGGSW